jgi:hypothetical protein
MAHLNIFYSYSTKFVDNIFEKSIPLQTDFSDYYYFFLIRILRGVVHTESTRHVGNFWPMVHVPSDGENGKFGGIKIGRGN